MGLKKHVKTVCVCLCVCVFACMRTCVYAYTHTHTHTHTVGMQPHPLASEQTMQEVLAEINAMDSPENRENFWREVEEEANELMNAPTDLGIDDGDADAFDQLPIQADAVCIWCMCMYV
jgi:hypothetical protein